MVRVLVAESDEVERLVVAGALRRQGFEVETAEIFVGGRIMAFISAEADILTVLNLFGAKTAVAQEKLLTTMRGSIDSADFPGWISSTLFGGIAEPGTANYIQCRSAEDLQNRYHGEKFQREIVPLFNELATSVRLLQTKVVFTRRRAGLDTIEIGPDHDHFTVLAVMGVAPADQQELVDLFSQEDDWLAGFPGYRHRGLHRGAGHQRLRRSRQLLGESCPSHATSSTRSPSRPRPRSSTS
ncbi:hypothetical protein [Amycolatopsis sp. NPDC051102]|uniref:hypothetical protein n=1 Tax=Amycolatopsis sp. NPDC051102 TaxID=3155163 RepID=UPI003441936A